jgi:hypothetical protein
MKAWVFFSIALFVLSANALALVSEGKPQKIVVSRSDKGTLVFTIADIKKSFRNAADCGKYCYQRSSWRTKKSAWSNEVYIKFAVDLSRKERQQICDRFVENKTYPSRIHVSFEYTYGPDDNSATAHVKISGNQ